MLLLYGSLVHDRRGSSDLCMLQYEPELFPGLIYRLKSPKVVMLIFVSGKVVLTGELPTKHFIAADGCMALHFGSQLHHISAGRVGKGWLVMPRPVN